MLNNYVVHVVHKSCVHEKNARKNLKKNFDYPSGNTLRFKYFG